MMYIFNLWKLEMATHSSTFAWRIPWREQPGRLQSMGSQRVGHDWVSSHGYIELAKKFVLMDFCKSLQKTLNELSGQPNNKRMKFNRWYSVWMTEFHTEFSVNCNSVLRTANGVNRYILCDRTLHLWLCLVCQNEKVNWD